MYLLELLEAVEGTSADLLHLRKSPLQSETRLSWVQLLHHFSYIQCPRREFVLDYVSDIRAMTWALENSNRLD